MGDKDPRPLDDGDLSILDTYSKVPFAREIKEVESVVNDLRNLIDRSLGVRDMDTGLAPRSQWDFDGDRQMLSSQEPLNVAHCEKSLPANEKPRYIISISHVAKFVVGLGKNVAPQDITEGARVGVDRRRYAIQLALHPRIDPIVTTMQVEEKPNVTYDDVGGCTA
jgi:26S proteasome regulatory subunit T1